MALTNGCNDNDLTSLTCDTICYCDDSIAVKFDCNNDAKCTTVCDDSGGNECEYKCESTFACGIICDNIVPILKRNNCLREPGWKEIGALFTFVVVVVGVVLANIITYITYNF